MRRIHHGVSNYGHLSAGHCLEMQKVLQVGSTVVSKTDKRGRVSLTRMRGTRLNLTDGLARQSKYGRGLGRRRLHALPDGIRALAATRES